MIAHIVPDGMLTMRKKYVPSSSIYAMRIATGAKIVIVETTDKTTRITSPMLGPH